MKHLLIIFILWATPAHAFIETWERSSLSENIMDVVGLLFIFGLCVLLISGIVWFTKNGNSIGEKVFFSTALGLMAFFLFSFEFTYILALMGL